MRYLFLPLILLLACGNSDQLTYDSFGQKITAEAVMDVNAFLKDVSTESTTYKVEGTIEEVCQKKGCWMTLRNEAGANIRVTFKDYGFFVPKDISGKKVIIEGEASKEVLDEDVAEHYADDEGKEYDESMRSTVSFVANGVLVAKS